jgi:hypothetical protein
MMKQKKYKVGKHTCNTYFKTVGNGYEVGCNFGPTQVFVGNFIHTAEATQYWTMLNKEIKTFCTKYWIGPKASPSWYRKFLTNYLYTNYYKFLDTKFNTYQRTYTSAFRKDETKYRRLARNWDKTDRFWVKAA